MPTDQFYANGPVGTLNGAIDSTINTLTVLSSTGFPATGNFTIKIDNEFLLVTAVSGTSWSITRGQEGSTGAAHADQSLVYAPLTDQSLRNVVTALHNGAVAAVRRRLNLIDTPDVTWTVSDDGGNDRVNITPGRSMDTMAYAATIALDVTAASLHKTTTVHATGDCTINASGVGTANQTIRIMVVNDATSGKVVTFGTNFKSTGTLTGTASKAALLTFTSDGTAFWESASRVTGLS